VPLLFPFWGLPIDEKSPVVFAKYVANGRMYFRLAEPDEAEFFMLPFDWRYTTPDFATMPTAMAAKRSAFDLAAQAADRGKRIIVFFVSDSDEEVPIENCVVFRTSLYRNHRNNEFSMPVFFEDLNQDSGSRTRVRTRRVRPSVGFCGFAGYRLLPNAPVSRQLRSVVRYAYRGFPPLTLRERAILRLRRHSSVETDFIIRENPKGHAALSRHAQEAFHRNIEDTDYTLCVRGRGNWSIRLYETLALGRIPLFVDTACVLPYDFEVNYRDLIAWVDHSSVESIGDRLVDFHKRLDAAQFADLQRSCRLMWEQRLTPDGFFAHFDRHFDRI
jgi:hypothetical protein